MPYADDSIFEDISRQYRKNIARVELENAQSLEERLAKEFKVPPKFMAIAVNIWWDGKED